MNDTLELSPFAAVPLIAWSNWERDPVGNRSWQWRLNWLSFLPQLLAYHHASEDDDVLIFASEAIQSWLDNYLNTDTTHPFEFIWHDHATALRAEQLLHFAYYCRKYAPNWAVQYKHFLGYLEQALLVHGGWLAKENFYSEHTNHGLEQARVLLLLGTAFEGRTARDWREIAIRRIGSELKFSFTSEGVHVENSPAYHVFVFKVFLGILKDYPDEVLGDLAAQFHRFSAEALTFITHILRPDGRLPPIGDTEQLPTSNAYQDAFVGSREYQHFLYAHSRGSQGEKPARSNVVYPKSGYAIFRDRWPDSSSYTRAFHAVIKAGCSSRYHHQEDEGHLSVYAGGEDWLIDSGLYNYINKDPIRRYMRSRRAHNVPLISSTAYDRKFEHRLEAWKVLDYSEDESSPSITMQIGVLLPIKHIRHVKFHAPNKVLEVADSFVADDRQNRNFILQWHIPKNKKITIKGQQVVVESTTTSRMHIDMDGPEPARISVARGIKDGKVASCISYKANKYEPSQVVRVAYTSYKALDVRTRFSFQLIE